MAQTDPATLSISAARRAIVDGTLDAETLTRSCLERIATREGTVHAWAHLDPDQAIAAAAKADAAGCKGILGGIPVGLKDIIDTAEMPTRYNSIIYPDHVPECDAACVPILQRAGAFIMGKTHTTTFAHRNISPACNPRNPAHTPGGSSSGSAAAVADNMVPLALGTQTGGSVLRPGAYCGVLAYKPVFDAIEIAGTKELAKLLDTLGFYVRSLDDLPLAGAALQGLDTPLAVADDTKPPKLSLVQTVSWDQAEPEGKAILEDTHAALGKAGAKVKDLVLPDPFPEIFTAHDILMSAGAVRGLAWEIENHWDDIPSSTQELIEIGQSHSAEAFDGAAALAESCRKAFPDIVAKDEILLTLPAPGEAPEGLGSTGNAEFNRFWTTLHLPCLQIPVGKGPKGLPLGVQMVARKGSEAHLFAAARWAARTLNLPLLG